MKLYVGGINMVSAYVTIVATELRIAVTCQAPSTLCGYIVLDMKIAPRC